MRYVLHIDINNCYATIESQHNPYLRGKPIAVCGDPERRHGIILAKSNEAKDMGVKTGEVLWEAKQKCPKIIFVAANMELYIKYSNMFRDILHEYSDHVESFGLDECWVDITHLCQSYEDGKKIADNLRKRMKYQLGLTCSVGVSYNKIFAKLGSDMKKPDATTVIRHDDYKTKVWPLPVGDLLYVGRKTEAKLARYGVKTIGDLAQKDEPTVKRWFGVNGITLLAFANGWDRSPVKDRGFEQEIKSIGNSKTAPRDLVTEDDVKIHMYTLCESVAARLKRHGFKCTVVQISMRGSDLSSFVRQEKLKFPTCTAKTIFDTVWRLYLRNRETGKSYRSMGVRGCNLVLDDYMQMSFDPFEAKNQKLEQLDRAQEDLRRRFGHHSVVRCKMLEDRLLSDFDPEKENTVHPVSYFI